MPHRISTRPHGRIRQARNYAKLPQTRLAEQLNVHRSAVSQWESPNGALPTLENMIKLARLTQVHMEWLATGHGSMRYEKHEEDEITLPHDNLIYDHDEVAVLKIYRGLKANDKKVMLDFLKIMSRTK
jgi:transcriptional regulator with XRE-family HTH domain